MKKDMRSIQLHFFVTPQENAAIRQRMAETGIVNQSAYLRKMALDGYILHLDMSDIRKRTVSTLPTLMICAKGWTLSEIKSKLFCSNTQIFPESR